MNFVCLSGDRMTDFYEKIYRLCEQIPEGKVGTYKTLAKAAKTKAYRAVGQAMKCNQNAPKTPCHRIILSSGEIGNYSAPGGVQKKIAMLKAEGVPVINGKVDLSRYLHTF